MYLPSYLKIALRSFFIVLIFLLFFYKSNPVFAALIYLNPATGSVNTQVFTITISLDPQGTADIGDFSIYLQYDPSKVSFSSVSSSSSAVLTNKLLNESLGVLLLKGYVNSNVSEITSLAEITFKALNSGLASFDILGSGEYISSVKSTSQQEILSPPLPQAVLNLSLSPDNFDNSYVSEATATQKAVPSTGYFYYFPVLLGFISVLLSFFVNRVYTKY